MSLCIVFLLLWCVAEEMDQADEELKETIRHIWPLQARKILDLLIPKCDCGFSYNIPLTAASRHRE